MRKVLIVLLLVAFLASCLPAEIETPQPVSDWWRDAVFYEVFVRSFYDSNGDGIGDLRGLIQKLDYLNDGDPTTTTDLGVTALWLMPIFPSPSYHGYDVTDYYSVNPQYGTLDDLKTLLQEAHRRRMRVIIDLVINHTSDQHPWFRQARLDVHSKYRNYYIWRESDPGYRGPWGQRVWHSSTSGFYYGVFTQNMPDLNYQNPEVTREMLKVVSFWIDEVGVDGFRLDAAKHLIENGATQQNTMATYEWYQEFHRHYKQLNPQAITVGEVFGDPPTVLARYVDGDRLDLVFDFGLAAGMIRAVQEGDASYARSALETSLRFVPAGGLATFLTNHDQDRLMSQLGWDVEKNKVAASMLLTAPGTPFLYYGEEIGMVGKKPDENIRRPMQWSSEPQVGFSTSVPWRAPGENWQTVNVAGQTDDPASLLVHYRTLIHLRNQHLALRRGETVLVGAEPAALYAVLRVAPEENVLILVNLSDRSIANYRLYLERSPLPAGRYQVWPLFGAEQAVELTLNSQGGFEEYVPLPVLLPYQTVLLQLRPNQ